MINLFLIVCIILWWVFIRRLGKSLDLNYKRIVSGRFLRPYLLSFVLFSIVSVSLIFILQWLPRALNFLGKFGDNVSHHTVFFRGFEKEDTSTLYLINDLEARRAVYPGLKGRLSITSSRQNQAYAIQADNLPYPLFVSTDSSEKVKEKKWVLKKNPQVQLVSAEDEGSIIVASDDTGEIDTIEYSIRPVNKKRQEYNLFFHYRGQVDSIKNKTIAYGLQLNGLLETTHLPLSAAVMERTQCILLLKDTVGYERQASSDVHLKWCGGENPLSNYWQQKIPLHRPGDVRIISGHNNVSIWPAAGNIHIENLPPGASFYLGIDPAGGIRTNGQLIFSFAPLKKGRMGVDFLQPSIYPLPHEGNPYVNSNPDTSSVFITSNVKGVWQRTNLTAGIVLSPSNIEKGDSNENYLFAILNYHPDRIGKQLEAVYQDINNNYYSSESNVIRLPSVSAKGVWWKLQLKNQWYRFDRETLISLFAYFICGLLLLWVFVRRWEDPFGTQGQNVSMGHPVLVWGVITLLGVFLVFRWFLEWRIHTYPPVENIDYDTYSQYYVAKSVGTLLFTRVAILLLLSFTALIPAYKIIRFAGRMGIMPYILIACVCIFAFLSFLVDLDIRRYLSWVAFVFFLLGLYSVRSAYNQNYYLVPVRFFRKTFKLSLPIFLLYYSLCFCISVAFLDVGFGINLVIALFISAIILLIIVVNYLYPIRRGWITLFYNKFTPVIILLAAIGSAFWLLHSTTKRHLISKDLSTQQSRVISLFGNADKMAITTELTSVGKQISITSLKQADENRYFIKNYRDKYPVFETRILPHTSIGSSYNTQLADTLPVRYIIAEHGFLPILIFSIALLTLMVIVANSTLFNSLNNTANRKNIITFFILTIITAFSILDIYININGIPFSGLNYLIFSLNDKGFSTVIFLIFLSAALFGVNYQYLTDKTFSGVKWKTIGKSIMAIGLMSLPIIFFLLVRVFISSTSKPYNLSALRDITIKYVDSVNRKYLPEYFGDTIIDLSQRKKYQDALPEDINGLFKDFCETASFKNFLERNKNGLYPAAYLKEFLLSNKNKWNPLNLVFAQKTSDGEIRLSVNESFFKKDVIADPDQELFPIYSYGQYNKGAYTISVNISRNLNEEDLLKRTITEPGTSMRLLALNAAAFRKIDIKKGTNLVTIVGSYQGNSFARPLINNNDNISMDNNSIAKIISNNELYAKGYWLNGKSDYLYPANSNSAWGYMLAQNIKNQQIDSAIFLSVDLGLQRKLDTIWQNIPDSIGVAVNVVDGNGKVRAFSQNRMAIPGDIYPPDIDFNYIPSQTQFNLLTLFLSPAVRKELMQNRNLLAADKPGSTIKPFTYAAVIAGANVNWEQLQLADNKDYDKKWRKRMNAIPIGNGEDYVSFFAGKRVGRAYMDNYPALEAGDFLSRSKNIYNHVITYLGSFRENDLTGSRLNNNNHSDILITEQDQDKPERNFPYLRLRDQPGQFYRLNPAKWPEQEERYFNDTMAVMPYYLSTDFGMLLNTHPDSGQIKKWTRDNISEGLFGQNARGQLYQNYLMPEYSWFNEEARGTPVASPDFRDAIFNTAIGAIVYNVAPLVHSKMAINLVKTNSNIKLSFLENAKPDETARFGTGHSYSRIQDFRSRLNNTVLNGMFRSNNNSDGTAYSILGAGWNNKVSLINDQHLYVYSKTGTAVEREGDHRRRKTLLLIITNGDLHNNQNTSDQFYKDLKAIAIYFQIRNNPDEHWSSRPEVISNIRRSVEAILSSLSVKRYFNL